MKANSNQAVLKTLAKLGSGVDVVSEGELRRALAAGIPASRIMFSGVGKTIREMDAALAADIYCFNIESEPELEVLNARALAIGKVAPISFRINPDVDAKTHAKISTGKKEDKFGISWQRYRDDNTPPPDPDAYGKMVKARLGDLGCKVILEPGRLIVANAGVLVTEVVYVKDGGDKTFVIVDAAMNDLIRPTLYDAWHEVRAVRLSAASAPRIRADIVGPVCESGDYLAKDREMAAVKAGDLLAVGSAGAYGAVQAGTYNTRPLIPEVLVKDDAFHVVRKRPSYEELIALDDIPAWLD
jgi:diaminopimelate decarboxylase